MRALLSSSLTVAFDLSRRPLALAALFCCQATICVLLLAMLVPPFENSDEFNHMKRADQIASGGLLATRYGAPGTSGGKVHLGIDQVDDIIGRIRFHPERKVSGDMLRQAGAIAWGGRSKMTFANTAIYPPFLYLPTAAGLFAAEHLGLSVARTLIIARATSAICSVLVATVAIAWAGEAALLLLILLSLPMSLSLFAAVSQDGPMLAASALAIALCARLRNVPAAGARPYLIALCAALALLGMGRPAYAPLAILPLLLPELTWRARIKGTSVVLLPIAAWSLVTSLVTMVNTEAHRGVHPKGQLVALALHPGRIWELAVHAATDRQGMEGLPFYKEFIGVLGWIDVILAPWFYALACIVIVLAVLTALPRRNPILPATARLTLAAAVAATICGIFLLEYATWTPVGLAWVQGVQGRYFLPAALIAPGLLPALRSPLLARLCNPIRLALVLFPSVSIAITIMSVVRRYYV